MKKVLTIAGSDCSGGAGIQADLKTIVTNKVYGMSVLTALTAQNTIGVSNIFDIPVEFIESQLDSIFSDIIPDAVKIGMVSNSDVINSIVEKLLHYNTKNIVVDPVMISTSGSKLLSDDAILTIKEKLLPIATIITPNIMEAQILADCIIKTKSDMENAAKKIRTYYKGAILIKGGHLQECKDDLLYINNEIIWYNGVNINNNNTHGTGCTLSTCIACNLAKNKSIEESVKHAKKYMNKALNMQLDIGHGAGPLDHSFNVK